MFKRQRKKAVYGNTCKIILGVAMLTNKAVYTDFSSFAFSSVVETVVFTLQSYLPIYLFIYLNVLNTDFKKCLVLASAFVKDLTVTIITLHA